MIKKLSVPVTFVHISTTCCQIFVIITFAEVKMLTFIISIIGISRQKKYQNTSLPCWPPDWNLSVFSYFFYFFNKLYYFVLFIKEQSLDPHWQSFANMVVMLSFNLLSEKICLILANFNKGVTLEGDHPFGTNAKFPKKLTLANVNLLSNTTQILVFPKMWRNYYTA